jgi:hypothetical protein
VRAHVHLRVHDGGAEEDARGDGRLQLWVHTCVCEMVVSKHGKTKTGPHYETAAQITPTRAHSHPTHAPASS